ncbi:MAG: hypothetical protein ACOVP8_08910 [Phycisphaerales bacterium]
MGRSVTMTAGFSVSKTGQRTGPRRPTPTTTDANSPPSKPVGRVPRVARLMALAIKLDGLIRSGEVASQRELAAVARVTPARVTQILNLLHLCPGIQETLLFLPPVTYGRDGVTERQLRVIASSVNWNAQQRSWQLIFGCRR